MGREAYLSRVVLGRSAFEAPIRDDSGNFVLGTQVDEHNDQKYEQQWNDRGRPYNPNSERLSKKFRQAQNEVLHACGVIVSKDVSKNQKLKRLEVPRATRLAEIEEENNIGFFFKGMDRIIGILSTWWLQILRRRLLISGSSFSSLSQMIHQSFQTNRSGLIYGGLPAGLTAGFARIVRQCETEETGIEPINFLEVRWGEPPFSEEKLRLWGAWILFMSVEIPFEFTSVLQSLGVPILPVVVDYLRYWLVSQSSSGFDLLANPTAIAFLHTISLYLLRDWTHFQLKRRLYQLLGQLAIRPIRPSQVCVDAADADDMVDATSILGLGRSLGTYTDCRFFGPLSFRKAVPIAFPWLSAFLPSSLDREAIKKETLARCLLTEDMDESRRQTHSQRSQTRARNILSNLESLGVDVEEDFFVDMDNWIMELDSITFTDMQRQRLEMSPIFAVTDHVIPSTEVDGLQPIEIIEAQSEEESRIQPEPIPDTEIVANHTENEEHRPSFSETAPSTPEQVLRRAPSLAQSAQLPVRRPTETTDLEFDDSLSLVLAEANRQRASQAKQKPKDPREFQITRLSIFTADSFTWHASSVLTNLVLLPLDAIFIRSLVGWYISAVHTPERILGNSNGLSVAKLTSLSANPWNLGRTVALSFGIECLIRGVFWQLGSRLAQNYSQRITTQITSSSAEGLLEDQ